MGHGSCALGDWAMLRPRDDISFMGHVYWVVVAYSEILRPIDDIYGS